MDGVTIKYIESVDELNAFMRWLSDRRNVLAIDTETGGLEWWAQPVRLIQFGDPMTAWVMRWDRWSGAAIEAIKRYDGQMVMHNAKFDCHMIEEQDETIHFPWWRVDDTTLMAHVLKGNRSSALKPLATHLVDPRASAAQSVLSNAMEKQGWGWNDIPHDYPGYWAYAGLDAIYTARLWDIFMPQLQGSNLLEVYRLDLCVNELLRRMEQRGCRIDVPYVQDNFTTYMDWCEQATTWCEENYGVKPTSNIKLADRLAQDGVVLTEKTPGGAISVAGDILRQVDHPLAQTALRVRQISKISSTYLKNFLELNDNGYVHPSTRVLGARTGRMSMSAPNLQNLPRDNASRPEALTVRNSFIARDDHVLIMADFDQIEQRMMAHYIYTEVGDRGMVDAFLAGGDFFTNMAQNIYHDMSLVKADPRRQLTKNASYATGYGAGTAKFGITAAIPYNEAEAFMASFHAMYPGLKMFQRHVEAQAIAAREQYGEPFVFDNIGRIHYASEGKLYTLVNYKIQGGAANVLKQKMLALDGAGLGDYMILPVHDEVISDVPIEHARDAKHIYETVMPDTESFAVPLTVGVDVVQRWGGKYTGDLVQV